MFINDYLEKKKRKERDETVKTVVIAAGVGIAAGLTAGVLLAPNSGKETRAAIAKKAEKAAEMAKNAAIAVKEDLLNKEEQLEKNSKDLVEKATDTLNKTIDVSAETLAKDKD
ncbi:MAG: YtxH domain-containing protein [Acidaminococcaceae bacterium]|nr:YtxH domain-containing protein [Acidaminococcaceae bacterium]